MKDIVRVGTVGAGSLSTAKIYPCFHKLLVELVAVCDLKPDLAEDRARRFGAGSVYTDVDEMLAQEDLDALVVCIGPREHVRMAKKALDAGVPVYTEKPPATSAADALEVAQVAQQKGLLVMTAFKKRYTPIYEKMKELMESDGFSPPGLVSIRRSAGSYAHDGDPRHEFLLDFCIHPIDLAAWLGGPVAEVFATSLNKDAYSVALQFESGAVGSLALAANVGWGYADEQVTVYGRGSGFIECRDMRQLLVGRDGDIRDVHRLDFSTAGADGLVESGFLPELQAFVEAVRTGDTSGVRSDSVESYRSMVLYEGIKESADGRKPVSLSYEL